MLDNNIFGKPLELQEWLRNHVTCVGVKTIEQPLLLLLPPISAQRGPLSPYSKNSKCNMTTSKQKLVPKELYPKTHVLGGNLKTLQIGAVSQKSSSTSDLVYTEPPPVNPLLIHVAPTEVTLKADRLVSFICWVNSFTFISAWLVSVLFIAVFNSTSKIINLHWERIKM